MDLSIIIPVWNEEEKIAQDILNAAEFLQNSRLSGEVIVTDDGSRDNSIQAALAVKSQITVPLTVIPCGQHFGKGYVVKKGMLVSRGDIVLFIDSGSCVPYKDVECGMKMIQKGICDIAQASRYRMERPFLKNQKWFRRIASWGFNKISRIIFHIPKYISDTQCGLKIYRGVLARCLFRHCKFHGFLFDIAIMQKALREGIKIREFPVQWKTDTDTRFSLIHAIPQLLKETISLMHH